VSSLTTSLSCVYKKRVRVNAIFGFADIRNFTFATEGLQGDVLIFVNKIAAITHKHVVNSGGHPNKNIGDAFLLVWKLKGGKNGTKSSGDLQKDLYDSALAACQRVIRDIRNAGNLASFLDDDGGGNISTAWASSLKSYNVAIGVGLHKGWYVQFYHCIYIASISSFPQVEFPSHNTFSPSNTTFAGQ
jgi:hypothetical protein